MGEITRVTGRDGSVHTATRAGARIEAAADPIVPGRSWNSAILDAHDMWILRGAEIPNALPCVRRYLVVDRETEWALIPLPTSTDFAGEEGSPTQAVEAEPALPTTHVNDVS